MTYLAKIGELSLKGLNIREFERLLVKNARSYLTGTRAKVSLQAGRLYVTDDTPEDAEKIEYALSHLLGITGWARARVCEKTADAICDAVRAEAEAAHAAGAVSFKIEARRADKSFPLTSYEICRAAADPVFESGLMRVDVHSPDVRIRVEVRNECYVFSDQRIGCRGLPVGCSGRGVLLLSGGIDSPVAGYRMMRRGMRVDSLYFHSYPYTSTEAQEKVETLGKIIGGYGVDSYLTIVPFTEVQMRIKEKSPPAWTTLMLRICMMQCANMLAEKIRADCIITGESLGQVASQTIENMRVTERFARLPLLRPLVGLDKEEITETAKFIGTYETSILPYEDCCVLFSPKHPVLRADYAEAEKIYAALEADELIRQAFERREVRHFTVGGN